MSFSEQFIQVVDDLCRRFGIMIDWTSENIMPYLMNVAERIAKYEIATSGMWAVFCIIVTLICGWLIYLAAKIDEDLASIAGIFLGIVIIFAIATVGVQIGDITKAIYLPELTTLEFLKTLLTQA